MLNKMKRVLALCVEISTKTKADCFFTYSPHCNTYCVSIHRDGWKDGEEGEWIELVTHCEEDNLKRTIAKLKKIYKEVKEKENGK